MTEFTGALDDSFDLSKFFVTGGSKVRTDKEFKYMYMYIYQR